MERIQTEFLKILLYNPLFDKRFSTSRH